MRVATFPILLHGIRYVQHVEIFYGITGIGAREYYTVPSDRPSEPCVLFLIKQQATSKLVKFHPRVEGDRTFRRITSISGTVNGIILLNEVDAKPDTVLR